MNFGLDTGKSLSEALIFAEHGENMLCSKIILNVRNNFCSKVFFISALAPQTEQKREYHAQTYLQPH